MLYTWLYSNLQPQPPRGHRDEVAEAGTCSEAAGATYRPHHPGLALTLIIRCCKDADPIEAMGQRKAGYTGCVFPLPDMVSLANRVSIAQQAFAEALARIEKQKNRPYP